MTLRKVQSQIDKRLREIERELKPLVHNATREFVRVTPKRTGNARKSTKQRGNSIDAHYEYATSLNEGYSRQAPDGMTKPTIEFIRSEVRKIMR